LQAAFLSPPLPKLPLFFLSFSSFFGKLISQLPELFDIVFSFNLDVLLWPLRIGRAVIGLILVFP